MRTKQTPRDPEPQKPVQTGKGDQKPPVKFTDWAMI